MHVTLVVPARPARQPPTQGPPPTPMLLLLQALAPCLSPSPSLPSSLCRVLSQLPPSPSPSSHLPPAHLLLCVVHAVVTETGFTLVSMPYRGKHRAGLGSVRHMRLCMHVHWC